MGVPELDGAYGAAVGHGGRLQVCQDRRFSYFLKSHRASATISEMNAVTLEYPDAWLAAMGTDAQHFAEDAKMAAAMKLFEMGRFTSGQAAQVAGVARKEFLLRCREWGVDTVEWDAAELDAEFARPLPPRT
jgi:hypothetical protein